MNLAAALIVIMMVAVPALVSAQQPAPGIESLYRLDLLPRFRDSAETASFSSYDRSGGNDDGFSGRYSFLRKEDDALVIAEMKGPGVIYRIWTPTPTDDPIEIYFDGEPTPRIRVPFRGLFTGEHPPFLPPLSGYGAGGFYCYLPIPYRESCKVLYRGPRMQFYQINYATYAAGTPVQTYTPGEAQGTQVEQARALLSASGTDISRRAAPESAGIRTVRVQGKVLPGGRLKLFESRRGGRIVGIHLSPARALAGKDRAILLRAFWDGESEPSVLCPAGDFFGASWGEPAARSLLFGTRGETAYSYFPMPFERSAKLELVSERTDGAPLDVQGEVLVCDVPKRSDEGRFYAVWRRENPTTRGRPFTFVEAQGRGHLVGVTLQAQGFEPGVTPFFEGDDQATIDGKLAIHGTGSEDFFNGGLYDVPGRRETRVSFPLSGCLDYKRAMGRSGGYRLMLSDAVVFRQSLHLAIEHAPERNELETDYVGVSFLYADRAPSTRGVPPVADRAVADPNRLVFTPGWYVPIHAFSIQNATLTKRVERVNNREERILSLRAEGTDIFGEHHLSLLCDVPAAGRYRVSIEVVTGPAQGIAGLYSQERAVGRPFDMYSETRAKSALIPMGELLMAPGLHQVFFKLTGKNPRSTGLALDLVTLVLERLESADARAH